MVESRRNVGSQNCFPYQDDMGQNFGVFGQT